MSVVQLLREPITFRGADGTDLHAPMIQVTVGGVMTRFVLDTGSDTHLLNKELVDEIGLAAEPGEQGTDHAGTVMPSWTVGTVSIRVADVDLPLTDVVAIPAPPPFPGWGVGGILSPQRLWPEAQVVVDMVHDELVLLGADEVSARSWARGRHVRLHTLLLDRVGEERTIVVSTAVSPHPRVPTLVDTGGRDTEFAAEAAPGTRGKGTERLGGSVSGADVMGARIGPAILLVGDSAIRVENLAIRNEMDPPGLIGMDVLRGTVIVCNDNPEGHVLWMVPPAWLVPTP